MGLSATQTQLTITTSDSLQLINLSNITFSIEEVRLLQKGLTFTPTPNYNAFTWVKDINLFARKLALSKYHTILARDSRYLIRSDQTTIRDLEELELDNEQGLDYIKGPFSNLKPKSSFTPAFSQFSNIDTFVELTSQIEYTLT